MARSNSKRKYDSKKRTQKNKATEKQHNKLKVAREISRRNQIACEYGLPDTAKFFFLEKKPSSVPRKLFHHGIVVLVDKKSLELLLIAQFNEFSDMHPELLVQFESSISTFYLHGISRGFVKNNGATRGVNRPGDMRAMGWRSAAGVAADVGKDVCHYSLNQATSKSEGKIWIDIERNSLLLPQAKDFWAERFSILSMSAFSANSQIAAEASVPSFDSPGWETSANSQVWASNVAITRDNFTNKPHRDKDATPYAFGMFARVNRETGKPHDIIKNPSDCHIEGSIFCLSDYAVGIDFDNCNGIVEIMENASQTLYTQVHHEEQADRERNHPIQGIFDTVWVLLPNLFQVGEIG